MQIAIVIESSDNVSVAAEEILSTARRSQVAVVAVILSNLMTWYFRNFFYKKETKKTRNNYLNAPLSVGNGSTDSSLTKLESKIVTGI